MRSKASLSSSFSILLGPIAFYLLIVFQASLPTVSRRGNLGYFYLIYRLSGSSFRSLMTLTEKI